MPQEIVIASTRTARHLRRNDGYRAVGGECSLGIARPGHGSWHGKQLCPIGDRDLLVQLVVAAALIGVFRRR